MAFNATKKANRPFPRLRRFWALKAAFFHAVGNCLRQQPPASRFSPPFEMRQWWFSSPLFLQAVFGWGEPRPWRRGRLGERSEDGGAEPPPSLVSEALAHACALWILLAIEVLGWGWPATGGQMHWGYC